MKLSKEQMFDFILDNEVTLKPNTIWWTRHDEKREVVERYKPKYYVSINETCMAGMDLEDAIQYYHDSFGVDDEV